MSLIDDLRRIENFPVSHLPSLNEVLQIVGVLTAYVEHGPELLKAVEDDAKALDAGEKPTAVNDLLSPPEQPDEPQPAPPAPPSAPLGTTSSQGSAAQSSPPVAPAAVPPAGAPDAGESDQARVQRLEQELQTAKAQLQRTQTSVTPGDPGTTPADTAPGAAEAW